MGTPYPSYGPPKLVESIRIEGFPPRTPQTLEQQNPQNRAPFLMDLGRESKGKEPRRVHAYIPQQIIERKASKSLREKHQEEAPKNTKKENREELKQALRNHAESSIHNMKVHRRSSFCPIILPSHKISP
jgi:flagellar motor switch protein FliM